MAGRILCADATCGEPRWINSLGAIATLVGALLGAWSCAPGRGDRPDIVLIVVDTLRADHVGAYGHHRETTPHLDVLASRGVLFENAWATAPWTLPSVMSIHTGLYPSDHRVENDGLKLGAEVSILAEQLSAAGYETAAFVSHVYVSRPFGFDRGFDTFEDFGIGRPGYRVEAGMEPTADIVTEAALARLGRRSRAPLFLFVHYFDPHWPYDPPPQYRELFPNDYNGPLDASYDSISRFQDPAVPLPDGYRAFLEARYDGEIRFVDEMIGRLLDALDERAWVVVTADHGEEYKEHGSMGHGRQLYEESIRVPLVIAGPRPRGEEERGDGGLRITSPVSGVDLHPTILDLAGIVERGPKRRGVTLVPILRGDGSLPADRPLVSGTIRLNAYRTALRRDRLKLIHFMDRDRNELFDLEADPEERDDLAPRRPDDRRALLATLFREVDLLSGGWNLSWTGDGRPARFQGHVTTDGIFRSVVPLLGAGGSYDVQMGRTLRFADIDQTQSGGISFTTAPEEARVTFYLMIDGEPARERTFLGGQRIHPPEMPFGLGAPNHEAAYARPQQAAGRERGFFLWRSRPAGVDQEIVLDDAIRERLRSLGYIDSTDRAIP